jgi:hypothetical protein
MQQLGFYGGVYAHDQCQGALGLGQATGTLDQLMARATPLFETPQRCTLLRGVARFFMSQRLHFPVEIVRQHCREQTDLVASLFTRGDVVHLRLRFGFGENAFLGAAPVKEAQRFFGANRLVGHSHLEVVTVLIGNEQVQLDGILVLFAVLAADEYEMITIIPTCRFPVHLEEAALPIETAPAFALLDQALERGKAVEWNTDAELNDGGVQHANNVITEKGAVHARLNLAAWQYCPDFPDAIDDGILGAIGIVYIARSVPDIEYLSSLGDGGKQRVVAALAFLLVIETDGRAFKEKSHFTHQKLNTTSSSINAK